jgi:predicted transcriptional regulator
LTPLTELPPEVDADPGDLAPPALMMTVSEIADRDGVSKQAVSKRVAALVESQGLAVERNARGHVERVNVAQYDHLRDRHGDPSKDQRPSQPETPAKPDAESYEESLRLKTLYEATRRGLELDETLGKLVRVEELEPAADDIGAEIAGVVRSLETEADAYAAALMRDGPHGLRLVMKQTTYRMLTEIAEKLGGLAALAAKKANASAGT